MIVRFNITPIGAVRQTRADAWKKRPEVLRYRAFKDSMRLKAAPYYLPSNPLSVEIDFFIPMPNSWSKKKCEAMNGTLHRQKPDIDNLWKAATDALWPDDDSCIACCSGRKFWAINGCIEMTVNSEQVTP